MKGSTSPCVPTIRIAILSGGSGTAGSRSEPSQSSCCRRRRLSCRARLATLDELILDAGRSLLSACPGAAPRSCALPVAFIAASMANPTRRSLGVRGTPWSTQWRESAELEGVSSSAGGGLSPSSRLANAGSPLRQLPEGRLGDLGFGELSVALPAPVALSKGILGGALAGLPRQLRTLAALARCRASCPRSLSQPA